MKGKKSFAYYVGMVVAYSILIALATCVLSVVGALTFRFVGWMLGGII